jgi:tetratricopeptide (TPR) repeat protein
MSIRSILASFAIAATAMAGATANAGGQSVPAQAASAQANGSRPVAKRTPLPSAARPACPSGMPAPVAPGSLQRSQARELASRAQQSAILGDTASARARLRDARALDPTDPDLAYQLARMYESGAASDSAVSEYCHFLALSPNGADAADARARVSILAKPIADPKIEAANAIFRDGLAAYDAGRMIEAEAKFARAIEEQPTWADAYYDRALAREAQGRRELAAVDLEAYLRMNPAADDRSSVSARIASLRRARLSPGQAAALGVLIPGAGQFYTHRPGWGTVFLLTAGSALGFGLMPQDKTKTVQRSATDPFGNPYTYTTTERTTERPNLVAGAIAAAFIDLMGASEAAIYAGRANRAPPQRVSLEVLPSRSVVALRLAF